MTYRVRLSHQAKRALTDDLPEAVAAACCSFVYGPLAQNPFRVGRRLRPPLVPAYSARRGQRRVFYQVTEQEMSGHEFMGQSASSASIGEPMAPHQFHWLVVNVTRAAGLVEIRFDVDLDDVDHESVRCLARTFTGLLVSEVGPR